MLRAENISFKIGNKFLVKDFSFEFRESKFIVIMGKNGAGKTTLLRMLSGNLKATEGKILIDKIDIGKIKNIELAKKRAVLSQQYDIPFPIDVFELVMMGRYPYYKNSPASLDFEICDKALSLLDITHFKERDYNSLSGGEARKVHLARTLAQIWNNEEKHKFLLLDEPVSNLDLKFQQQIIKIAKEQTLNKTCVIAILHDINLANTFADEIIFLKSGILHSVKKKEEKLKEEILYDIFDTEFEIIRNDSSTKEFVSFKN